MRRARPVASRGPAAVGVLLQLRRSFAPGATAAGAAHAAAATHAGDVPAVASTALRIWADARRTAAMPKESLAARESLQRPSNSKVGMEKEGLRFAGGLLRFGAQNGTQTPTYNGSAGNGKIKSGRGGGRPLGGTADGG